LQGLFFIFPFSVKIEL